MFLFQSDSDLPNILLGITLLIIVFLSLIHSPESLAMSPLGRLKDLLMGFVFRRTSVGFGDPVSRSAHPPMTMELPTMSGAPSTGTQTVPSVNAVQDTATPSHHNHNPPVFNSTPTISCLNQIITQIMPIGHTPIPLRSAISIITAHVAVTSMRSSRFNLLVDESDINLVVEAFALALVHPTPTSASATQHVHDHDNQRAVLNHFQSHIQRLNINLPEKTITTSFAAALALNRHTLSILIKSPNQGALRGFYHISMEPTQRTFVGFKSLGQAARGWRWRWLWLRARLGVGRSSVHDQQMDSVESSTVDHAYDLERGEVLGATDKELNNWVEEMTKVVIQGVRRMCELIPPEDSGEEGVRICEGAGAGDDAGWKIKLKD